jgi:hypothetical protein
MTDGTTAARGAASTKPTVESLGIDVGTLNWQRSGTGDGAIEVAMVGEHASDAAEVNDTAAPVSDAAAPVCDAAALVCDAAAPVSDTAAPVSDTAASVSDTAASVSDTAAQWVLMRVSGDAAGRVLVYDRNEWECFLDGVRAGEFDTAAS